MLIFYIIVLGLISVYPFTSFFNPAASWQFSNYFDDKYNFLDFPELNSLMPSKQLLSLASGFEEKLQLYLTHILKIISHRGINVFEPVGGLYKAAVIDIVGFDPRGIHQFSYYNHIFNGILLYIWMNHLFYNSISQSKAVSRYQHLITAIFCGIFLIHPLNMEVIGWLSAHTYVPALSFALLSSIYLERLWYECSMPLQTSSTNRKSSYFLLSILSYLAAVWCKAPAITLVGHHILRISSLFLQETPSSTMTESIPTKQMITTRSWIFVLYVMVAVGVFGGLITLTIHSNQGSVPDIMTTQYLTSEALSFQETWTRKLLKALYIIGTFMARFWFPTDLRSHYNPPPADFFTWGQLFVSPWDYTSSLLIYLFFTFFLFWIPKTFTQFHILLTSVLSYLLFWLPGCGIVQHGWSHLGGDRYNYFPIAYSLPGMVLCIYSLARQDHLTADHHHHTSTTHQNPASSEPHHHQSRRVFVKRNIIIILLLLIMYCYATISKLLLITWQEDVKFLTHCVQMDPQDWECNQYLGDWYGAHSDNVGLAAHYSAEAINAITKLAILPSKPAISSVYTLPEVSTTSSGQHCTSTDKTLSPSIQSMPIFQALIHYQLRVTQKIHPVATLNPLYTEYYLGQLTSSATVTSSTVSAANSAPTSSSTTLSSKYVPTQGQSTTCPPTPKESQHALGIPPYPITSPRLLMFQATIFYRYHNIASSCAYSIRTTMIQLALHLQYHHHFLDWLPTQLIDETAMVMQRYEARYGPFEPSRHKSSTSGIGDSSGSSSSGSGEIEEEDLILLRTIDNYVWHYLFTSPTLLSYIHPELLPMFVNNFVTCNFINYGLNQQSATQGIQYLSTAFQVHNWTAIIEETGSSLLKQHIVNWVDHEKNLKHWLENGGASYSATLLH